MCDECGVHYSGEPRISIRGKVSCIGCFSKAGDEPAINPDELPVKAKFLAAQQIRIAASLHASMIYQGKGIEARCGEFNQLRDNIARYIKTGAIE